MIVQIYAATSVADAETMVTLGVDRVGFIAGVYDEVPAELTFAQAREITDAVRGDALVSALTMSVDLDEICRMVDAVRPDIVHISTDTHVVTASAMADLRRRLPDDVRMMKAAHVAGPESLQAALEFAVVADMLLLDSKVEGMPGVGATGRTHDWAISRRIVEEVGGTAEVILAGGLTPENVAAAIQATHPTGVDSNTGTNLHGDRVVKDMDRVDRFVRRARLATTPVG